MEYTNLRQMLHRTQSPFTRDGYEQYKDEIRQAKMRLLTHVKNDERFRRFDTTG